MNKEQFSSTRQTIQGINEKIQSYLERSDPYRLPFLDTESLAPRTDNSSVFEEAEGFSGLARVNLHNYPNYCMVSGITTIASPRVPSMVDRDNLVRSASRILGRVVTLPPLLNSRDKLAGELIVWFGLNNVNEQKYRTFDLLSVAGLKPDDLTKVSELLEGETKAAIEILAESAGINDYGNSDAHRNIIIVGSFGHTPVIQRIAYGVSRGAQSAPDGHFIVSIKDQEDIHNYSNIQDANPDELLKQISPIDGLLLREFHPDIQRIILGIGRSLLPNDNNMEVDFEINYKRRTDGKSVPFYEGFRIKYDEAVPFAKDFELRARILERFGKFYDGMFRLYFSRLTNLSNSSAIRKEMIENARSTGFQNPEKIVDLILSFQPTKQMINGALEMIKISSQKKPEDIAALEKVRRMISIVEANFKPKVKHRGKKLFDRYTQDRVKDPDTDSVMNSIQFVFPGKLSGRYCVDDYEIRDDRLFVRSSSISTSLASNKGPLEDEFGVAFRRK